MLTKIITQAKLDEAALCLKNGGTVVFPTETVYGLGADAFQETAIDKIYKAKGRPGDNPLIVHIAKAEDIDLLVREIPPYAKKLMDAFWPGPLTMIFKKNFSVIDRVTAGLDTVAVRYPSNPIAQELIARSGVLVAAPSANLSGSPSPTVCKHVIDDLNGRVDYIIDGTGCEVGLESTVLDVSGDTPIVLRPGGITLEMLKEYIPSVRLDGGLIDNAAVPKCPGLKYTHYSPKADVTVVMGTQEKVRAYISEQLMKNSNCGVLAYKNTTYTNARLIFNAGDSMKEYAHNLFYLLREFDKHKIEKVYAEFADEKGLGIAVRNRLFKAAGHKVVEV